MDSVLMLLAAFVMGFLAAIPIGPSQIEIIKRALNNNLRAALVVVAGTVSTDVIYGGIALFGVAQFLQHRPVVAVFGIVGAGVLGALAVITLRQGMRPLDTGPVASPTFSLRISYLTGLSIGATNPIMMFWWLVAAKIVLDLDLAPAFTPGRSLAFLAAGVTGIASYLSGLALVLSHFHRMVPQRYVRRITLGLGIFLVLLAFYLLTSSIRVLVT